MRNELTAILGAVALSTLGGCGGGRPTPEPTPPPSATGEGAELYARYCALCHGESGEGYAADNATRLAGQDLLRTASDRLFAVAIARGRPHTAMAGYVESFGGPLSEAQIDVLVSFLRGWQTEPALTLDEAPSTGDPERGAIVFGEHCASCHGEIAQGGPSAQSLNRWSFLSEASDAFLRYAIVHGRPDTPMPAFESTLEPGAIEDVVAFLRRFEEEPDTLPMHLRPPPIEEMTLIPHPDGEAPQFTLREGRFVPAAEVRDAIAAHRRLIILDARPASDWLIERIPGAVPVPYYDIAPIIDRLPRDGTWILAYCGCPHAASGQVVDALREAGFEHTAVIDEGVYYWIDEGFPTEHGALSHDDAR
ncbi:MAG: c-type cytochrome [Sandaracinaceae bacterium]